nr:Gag-Pol polyprotein [Tanacetum cinerariifolium]
MLEEMVGISLESMLDKWHKISKGTMHDRMVGLKLIRMQFRMRVFRVVELEWVVVVPGITNQNGTGNIIAARAEGFRNGNQARCYNYRGLGHIARNCTTRSRRRDAAYLQTQLLIAQKEEARIQLQAEEFDFMAAAGGLDEIEEEEQHTDLLEIIPEPQLVPQNENHVTSFSLSMVQSGGTIETSSAPNEETRAHPKTVYRNLVDQVAQIHLPEPPVRLESNISYQVV